MSAIAYDLYLEQGATKVFEISLVNFETGEPIDLTGYQGRGQIRINPRDVSPLASFNVTIPNPTSGVINVRLESSAMNGARLLGKNFNEKTIGAYDIEIYTSGDQEVIRVANGKALISPGVTK